MAVSPSASDGPFLIIGCGSIGKRHLSNLQQLGVRHLLAFDISKSRLREVGERFGAETTADLPAALGSKVKVALVCSPTHLHLEHALQAARAGLHLFIEKPLAHKAEGLDELIGEVARRDLVTLVGCNFRFHPGLRRVKALLEKGAIGRVLAARAEFGQYLPDWRPQEDYRASYSAQRGMGGGVLLDRIHEIDYIRWLLGEVVEVYSMMGHLSSLEIDTEDTAEILLRFQTGAFGSVHIDYVRRTYNCRLDITGECGTIQWSYQDRRVCWYRADEEAWQSVQWPHYDGNVMYRDEMRHFLNVLEGNERSEQDVAEGRKVLQIALAAQRASEVRKAVVL